MICPGWHFVPDNLVWRRRLLNGLTLEVWRRPAGRWRWALRVSRRSTDRTIGQIRHFGSRGRAMQVGEERA